MPKGHICVEADVGGGPPTGASSARTRPQRYILYPTFRNSTSLRETSTLRYSEAVARRPVLKRLTCGTSRSNSKACATQLVSGCSYASAVATE